MRASIYDGVLHLFRGRSFNKRLLEVSFSWGLALKLSSLGSETGSWLNIHLIFINIFLRLPIKLKNDDIMQDPEYGFNYHGRALWIHWGIWNGKKKQVLIIHMPWYYGSSFKQEYFNWEGVYFMTVEHRDRGGFLSTYDAMEQIKNFLSGVYDYTYTLKSGEVQQRKARIYVTKQYWKMHWFPFIHKVSKCINVTFSDEVGERTGTWKGGCISCGYEMKPGETPEQTLRRMERERKF